MQYSTVYLINNEGRLVHSWDNDFASGGSVYLLENGNLLRLGRVNGGSRFGRSTQRVLESDWDGNVVWEFDYTSDQHALHHDIERLPNGNVLMIVFELKTVAEAIAAGRDPSSLPDSELWPDHIIEVEPTGSSGGNIVWEWHVWDHLIQNFDPNQENFGEVADHPELLDINFVGRNVAADWLHVNAIDYNSHLDQIVLSSPFLNEIWVVDHSTSSEEAASHSGGRSGMGGDILYRWGNPRVYGAGTAADQKLFFQHNPQWIESGLDGEGNILVFNNGQGRPDGAYSSVDEIETPVDADGNYLLDPGPAYGPAEQTWVYTTENRTDFYSNFISGTQRLPNGNTLICSGANGTFFEITSTEEIVWRYINPVVNDGPLTQGDAIPVINDRIANGVFRANRYGPDYPGLAGKDLTPGDPIEINPTTAIAGDVTGDGVVNVQDLIRVINIILGIGEVPDEEERAAADVNGDGVLNVSDLIAIINIILSVGVNADIISTRSGYSPANLAVERLPSELTSLVEIPVIASFDIPVAGIQLKLSFDPESFNAVQPKLTTRTQMMALESKVSETGLTVLMYNRSGKTMPAGNGAILSLVVSPKGSTAGGTLKIEEAILVSEKGDELVVNFGIPTLEPTLPRAFSLRQNYPNPFNPSTTISFQVPEMDELQAIPTTLKIYNVRGQLVKTLMDESLLPDIYSVHWGGVNNNGEKVGSGIYLYTITARELRATKKMLLLK